MKKVEIRDIIKFETKDENERLSNDIENSYPKYKKALYEFYKDNNEKFPFDEFSFKDDLIMIVFLNEYGYSHDIVLKALDEFLIPSLNSVTELFYVLSFLHGFGVIDKSELDERNEIGKILNINN